MTVENLRDYLNLLISEGKKDLLVVGFTAETSCDDFYAGYVDCEPKLLNTGKYGGWWDITEKHLHEKDVLAI